MKVIRGITLATIVLLSLGVQTAFAFEGEGEGATAEPISGFVHEDFDKGETA